MGCTQVCELGSTSCAEGSSARRFGTRQYVASDLGDMVVDLRFGCVFGLGVVLGLVFASFVSVVLVCADDERIKDGDEGLDVGGVGLLSRDRTCLVGCLKEDVDELGSASADGVCRVLASEGAGRSDDDDVGQGY